MPQVQAGQVAPGQDGAPALYGVGQVQNTMTLHERLLQRFQPQDFVKIKNISSERVYWQYLPDHAEEITHDPGTQMKTVMRKEPELWYIEAGATEALVGASAYHALDVMYKQCAAEKTLGKLFKPSAEFDSKGEHIPKNFNFADGGAQEDFIKAAYLGKVTPSFGSVESLHENTKPAMNIATQKAKELTNASSANA